MPPLAGNFLIAAHPTTAQRAAPNGTRTLIAPFERDPQKRGALSWTDRTRPKDPPSRLAVGTDLGQAPNEVAVMAYKDYFDDYRGHPAAKARDATGERCKPWTRGPLQPRHVKAASLVRIGKEANRLAESAAPEDEYETSAIDYPRQSGTAGAATPACPDAADGAPTPAANVVAAT